MTMQNRARLLKRLAAIQGAPRKVLRAALAKSAEEITAMQKRLAPVDSGDLRDSIGYTFGSYTPDNANVRGVAAGGGGDPDLSVTLHAGNAKAFYAAFIEFGAAGPWEISGKFQGAEHPGFKPQPYFYPAYRALRKRAKGRITRTARKAIRDAAQS
jgi:HK97 gp10 family phage protein